MRILVAGGSGKMAFPAEIHLLEQNDVTEILLVDMDQKKLDERVTALGNDKRLSTKVLDLMDVDASAKVFKGYDCILSMATIFAN